MYCFSTAVPLSKYEETVKFVEKLSWHHSSSISEEYLTEILSLLETHGILSIPKESEKTYDSKWDFHMHNLKMLEVCFRKSQEFTIEKASNIFYKHFEAIKKQGFEINGILNRMGDIPLCAVTYSRHPALVKALIKAGADINSGVSYCNGSIISSPLTIISTSLSSPFEDGLTEECIQILTKHGCDPNKVDRGWEEEKTTPLWLAALNGHDAAVRALVNAKAHINTEINDPTYSTALQAATLGNGFYLQTMKVLVELGANLFTKNSKQQTALDLSKANLNHFRLESKGTDDDLARIVKHMNISAYFEKAMEVIAPLEETRVTLLAHNIPKCLIGIVFEYIEIHESVDESVKLHAKLCYGVSSATTYNRYYI